MLCKRLYIFFFTAIILLARPVLVFGSPVMLHAIEHEVKTYGLSKAVRKRKEIIYTFEEFALAAYQQQEFKFLPVQRITATLRKWLHQLLQLLSFLFAYLLALSRNVRGYADIRPQTDRYKTLAVFLI